MNWYPFVFWTGFALFGVGFVLENGQRVAARRTMQSYRQMHRYAMRCVVAGFAIVGIGAIVLHLARGR